MTFQTDEAWTTSTYRHALDAWRANAPADDSKIMPKIRASERPLNAALAGFCRALLVYRSEPSGSFIKSNWRLEPYEAVNPEDIAELATDRLHDIVPSMQDLRRQFEKGEVATNKNGQVIGIGTLQFSDGTQHERGYTKGPDGSVIRADLRMPTGAMLRTSEKQGGARGGTVQQGTSNRRFAEIFGVSIPAHIPGSRNKRRGKSYKADESRKTLAEAIANTPVMPDVKHYPVGLPAGSATVGDIFIGLRKRKTGRGGAIGWEDQFSAIRDREAYRAAQAALPAAARRAMETALDAEDLGDIGRAAGHDGDYARKAGRRLLIAANDNFATAMEKFAA